LLCGKVEKAQGAASQEGVPSEQ